MYNFSEYVDKYTGKMEVYHKVKYENICIFLDFMVFVMLDNPLLIFLLKAPQTVKISIPSKLDLPLFAMWEDV